MFLSNLNSNQKNLFIQLAIKAAESNGIVPIEQKNMLKAFAMEMSISPVYKTERDTEDIINELIANSNERELKIVLFEILGIIVVDSDLDDKEKMFVSHMVEKCNLSAELIDQMVKLLDDYTRVYKAIVDIVM